MTRSTDTARDPVNEAVSRRSHSRDVATQDVAKRLQGVLQAAMSQHVNHPVPLGEVFSLLWHPRQEFWFLYALFVVYVYVCLLYAVLPARLRWILLAGAVVFYFLRGPIRHSGPFITYPAWYLVYFLAGALLHSVTSRITARPVRRLAIS